MKQVAVLVAMACGAMPVEAAPAPSAWLIQKIDDEPSPFTADFTVLATPTGPAFVGTIGNPEDVEWIRFDGARWVRETASAGKATGGAIDASGTWTVAFREDEVHLIHGAQDERLAASGYTDHDSAGTVALDAQGTPHVCISHERSNLGTRGALDTLQYAVRPARGPWKIETLPGTSHTCSLAIAGDGRIVLGTEDGVTIGRPGAWRTESLGGRTRVLRAADGTIAAVTTSATAIWVSRRTTAGWQRKDLVALTGAKLGHTAAALDPQGRVHVAWDEISQPGDRRSIHYAAEDGAPALIAADSDAAAGLGIAVDAAGQPHVMWGPQFAQRGNQALLYARHRAPGDPAEQYARERTSTLHACARLVENELGAEPMLSDLDVRRETRACAPIAEALPTTTELTLQCGADRDACLVLGALTGRNQQVLITDELTRDRCGKRTCTQRGTVASSPGSYLPKLDPDPEASLVGWVGACRKDSEAACFHVAWNHAKAWAMPEAKLAEIARTCSDKLPIACAAAIDRLDGAPTDEQRAALPPIRAALATACATSARPTACASLAFLEENGLGGKRDTAAARKHHLHACSLYSAASCARLLIGPLGRPAPPKGMDPDKLAAVLVDGCDAGWDNACLGAAAAFERGWVVPKDRARAAELRRRRAP